MPRSFFDTSALVKNYHIENGTPIVQAILATSGSERFISRLSAVEMLSGFAGKVRTGTLSSTDYGILRRRFFADIRKKVVRPLRILNAHYQLAGDLIGKLRIIEVFGREHRQTGLVENNLPKSSLTSSSTVSEMCPTVLLSIRG